MPIGLLIASTERSSYPILCQHENRDDEIENKIKFLSRKDFVNVLPKETLEKIFPPDSTLSGIDVEFFSNYVLIKPVEMHSIFINGNNLANHSYYAVNTNSKDVLAFKLDDINEELLISAYVTNRVTD